MERVTTTMRGVTLIETIVYLGLFSIVIGGFMISAFYLADSGAKTRSAIVVTEEGTFVNRKLAWAASGATDAYIEEGVLTLTRPDLLSEEDPLTFFFNEEESMLYLSRGSGERLPLVSDEFTVTNVSFSVMKDVAETPTYIRVSYEINGVPFRFDTYLRN